VTKLLLSDSKQDEDKEIKDSAKKEAVAFKDGDLVSIHKNATYYTGTSIPSWVKSQNWYVRGTPKGDRVVIDKNEAGTNAICSPIHSKYLTLVKASVS